jgi:hypothetical protein
MAALDEREGEGGGDADDAAAHDDDVGAVREALVGLDGVEGGAGHSCPFA